MPRGLGVRAVLGIAVLGAAPAGADQIVLRSGGRVEGIVVQQTPTRVIVDTSPGRISLPMYRVARVEKGRSALDEWRERSAALRPKDAKGWASLARWAAQSGLATQAAEAWQHVVEADPRNVEANRALGRVLVGSNWMPEEEAYRSRGFVRFEGRWVSQAEHEALVRERAAEESAEQQRREASVRMREAEAHAREAEARARGAEAANMPPADDSGIPLWYGGGYYPYGYDPYAAAYGYGYGGYGYGYGGYGGYGHGGYGGYGPGHGGRRYPGAYPTPYSSNVPTTSLGPTPPLIPAPPRGTLLVGPR